MKDIKEIRERLSLLRQDVREIEHYSLAKFSQSIHQDIVNEFDTLNQFINDVEKKETPKEPTCIDPHSKIDPTERYLGCPTCEKPIRFDFIAPAYRPKRCEWCGQMLDWRKENGKH